MGWGGGARRGFESTHAEARSGVMHLLLGVLHLLLGVLHLLLGGYSLYILGYFLGGYIYIYIYILDTHMSPYGDMLVEHSKSFRGKVSPNVTRMQVDPGEPNVAPGRVRMSISERFSGPDEPFRAIQRSG